METAAKSTACVLSVDACAGQITGVVLSFPAEEVLARHVWPAGQDVDVLLRHLRQDAEFLGCRVREVRIRLNQREKEFLTPAFPPVI